MALLETKNLSFFYPDEDQPAIDNLSLKVEKGEFLLISGPSGSGKSTLLQLLKQEISPFGKKEGQILYKGTPIESMKPITLAKEIGMIFQDPDNQIVMDYVLDELIFGLQNFGLDTETMRKKVAEMAHFFGIHHLLEESIHVLSGGQKQLVNLTAVLLMEPNILLLDEPTAQLDPVAAKNFLNMIETINKEFGLTIIMVEHQLDEVISLADRLIVLNQGRILMDDSPQGSINTIWAEQNYDFIPYLPSGIRLYLENAPSIKGNHIPLSVKDARKWIEKIHVQEKVNEIKIGQSSSNKLMTLKNVHFQYGRTNSKILNHLSLDIREYEMLAIVGANGTGKSTLLKVMAGLEKPQRGKILFQGEPLKSPNPSQIGYLPQNPKLLFVHDTIQNEFEAVLNKFHDVKEHHLLNWIEFFGVQDILNRHPYDVSGGELQKCALILVLLSSPSLLLLDEPTKGLDPAMKRHLGDLLIQLRKKGHTLVMVTHDIEFAASYSERCAMMFQGEITASAPTLDFFKNNTFYTTTINRITRHATVPEVVTLEEARDKWQVKSLN